QQPLFSGITAEDVGEPGGDHYSEPVVHQGPHRVLTRRAGAEIRPCHKDGPVGERLLVQHEVVVTTPGSEQSVLETGTADTLEVRGRNDLIRIHIGPTERHAHAAMCCEWLHLAASCSGSAARYGGFGRE